MAPAAVAAPPPPSPSSRQRDARLDTLRRLVRRGARQPIVKILGKVRPEDVALAFPGLTPGERLRVFRILVDEFPEAAGDVLTELDGDQRAEVLERSTPEQIATVLREMEVDDAVYVVGELPASLEEKVREIVDVTRLEEVRSHLTEYEDDTAGRIMTTEFFSLPASAQVADAMGAVREAAEIDMVFYLYVVDEAGHLVGVTSLRQLLLAEPGSLLGDVAQQDVIRVRTDTDQEDVARLTARYDLLAIPVVDEEDRLVGIVTVDDIVDILKDEATEDIYKMVGSSDDELLYQGTVKVAGLRLPWLLVNMVGLLVSGLLLEHFSRSLDLLFLLTFVPVVMGMAGNSGSQTSTITVRGLATGRIGEEAGRLREFLWQQVKVGAFLGVTTGILVALVAFLLQENPTYSVVVAVALFCAILLASASGAVIPVLFDRIGIDPAVAAGPLVTTSNDIFGLLIYFGIATLLRGALV